MPGPSWERFQTTVKYTYHNMEVFSIARRGKGKKHDDRFHLLNVKSSTLEVDDFRQEKSTAINFSGHNRYDA